MTLIAKVSPVLQVESFVWADRVVGVEPHGALTEDIRQVILGTFYVLDGVIVDLEVHLDIK